MANINIICTGKLKEDYLKQAQGEYTKRLGAFCNLNIIEKRESPLPKNASDANIEKACMTESEELLQSGQGYLIALSPEGKRMTSENFAKLIKEKSSLGDISFFIGGSNGLHQNLKEKADILLSFSDMTMPHQLFRIVLLEQVYRGFMISGNRTYHK